MDFRDILKSFDNLSEGEKTTTDKGTVHKAGAGGYGNKHGSEDVTDQYGKPVGRKSLSKMDDKPAVKRGKGRPPKNADSSGEVKKYDSSELSKAMGMGKAPKATGKPSVKHSLKEYFDIMDEALSEAGLTVQPMPATPAAKAQQQMATKPSFMIKDPANPSMPAITTQDPAVVQAAKNGTMSMQKPGAAPTSQGATPAAGAGSQVAPMGEDQLDELSPQLMKRAVKKADTMMNKNYYDDNHNATYDYANQGSRIQHGMDKRAGKPSEYKKADAYIKSEPGANTAKGHRMPVGMEEGDIGKHNNATTGFEALVRKLTPKYGKESAMKIAGAQLKKMSEAEAPQHFAQSSPLSTNNRGVLEGKKGVNPFAKKDTKKKPDADGDGIPDYAEDGKGPNDTKKKGAAPKKGVNPFAKKTEKKKVKEGMEHHLQAARLEGKSHALRKMPYNCTHDDMEEARCYHDGFKEGLDECYGQMPILGRTAVDEMGQGSEVDTMASYGADELGETHPALRQAKNVLNRQAKENPGRGFGKDNDTAKKSLTLRGLVKHGMVDQNGKFVRFPNDSDGEIDEMDKTSYMKQQAIKTPGDTFKAFGQTMHDKDVIDEFAFESLDKQLSALLESEEVSEGMTVSISKGQQGAPDSVSVSAQDAEADQLLSIIKTAGLGLFGGEDKGYSAPEGTGAHGGISVVDDHDGMMSLMKKLSGAGAETSSSDFADEEGHEGHDHGEEDTCNECGMAYESCGCDHDEPIVDETESRDQMAYEVAEDNPPDNGSANATNATVGNNAANTALAIADQGDGAEKPVAEDDEDDEEDTTGEEAGEEEVDEGQECKDCGHDPCDCDDEEEKVEEGIYESYANSADDTFEADIDFMTKVISGGLNKQKSTGQTTIPVIAGQKNRMGVDGLGKPMKESTDLLKDYRKLSGL